MNKKIPLSDEEAKRLCKNAGEEAKDFLFQQTMYRIKDPKLSIQFYTGVLGMKLLHKVDFPDMKFSLYYFGYEDPATFVGDLSSNERAKWTLSCKGTLELTHNWGTENDVNFKYHDGNSEPRGYGHIGIMVPDVDKACEYFDKHGVDFAKRPEGGIMRNLAFIKDPDGYWIEIFNNNIAETSN